jgi:hypothetical protein
MVNSAICSATDQLRQQHLVGPMKRLVANVKTLTPMRGGQPNDTEDWVGIIADFTNGATGCWRVRSCERTNESWRSLDYVEVNGSEATFEFTTGKWDELQHGNLADRSGAVEGAA